MDPAALLIQARRLEVFEVVPERRQAALEMGERLVFLSRGPPGAAHLAVQVGRPVPIAPVGNERERRLPVLERFVQRAMGIGGLPELVQDVQALIVECPVGLEQLEHAAIIRLRLVVGKEARSALSGARQILHPFPALGAPGQLSITEAVGRQCCTCVRAERSAMRAAERQPLR